MKTHPPLTFPGTWHRSSNHQWFRPRTRPRTHPKIRRQIRGLNRRHRPGNQLRRPWHRIRAVPANNPAPAPPPAIEPNPPPPEADAPAPPPPVPVEPADPANVLTQIKSLQNGGERPPGFGEIIVGPNGHRYLAVDAKLKWPQAREIAEQVGGHLVTITSIEEQHFVHDRAVGSIGPIQPRKQYWLGATDELIEGEWRWVTGEPWEFTSWAQEEPDGVPSKNHLSLMSAPRRPGQGWSDSGEFIHRTSSALSSSGNRGHRRQPHRLRRRPSRPLRSHRLSPGVGRSSNCMRSSNQS